MEEEKARNGIAVVRPLAGKRIPICGKEGSGQSSLIVHIGDVLLAGYQVALVDGDDSNPGSLAHRVLGTAIAPKLLTEFFGG